MIEISGTCLSFALTVLVFGFSEAQGEVRKVSDIMAGQPTQSIELEDGTTEEGYYLYNKRRFGAVGAKKGGFASVNVMLDGYKSFRNRLILSSAQHR